MNFKIGFFVFIIILCILLALPGVFAGDAANGNVTDLASAGTSGGEAVLMNDEILSSGDEGIYTFDDLHDDIMSDNTTLDVKHDYTYSSADSPDSSEFNCSNLVINGNGFSVNGKGSSHGLKFSREYNPSNPPANITINDMTFMNFNVTVLSFETYNIILNNVSFINCSCSNGGIVSCESFSDLRLDGCHFVTGNCSSFIIADDSNLTVNNTCFDGMNCFASAIKQNREVLVIENAVFENFHSKKAAILDFKGACFSIRNSKFRNSAAELSGGAILAKFFPIETWDGDSGYVVPGEFVIENCEFSNLSAGNDGGAIYIDLDSGSSHILQTLNISNSSFTSCDARFGGALAIQGGAVKIAKSNFTNNTATFEAGAIFTTFSDVSIMDTVIANNTAVRNAGAIYFDRGDLDIASSSLTGNRILSESEDSAGCIYAHDAVLHFKDSTFDNVDVSVYADFAGDSKMENVTKNEDIFLLDNKNYIVSVETRGIRLNITKNDTIIDRLPDKFNLEDYGWVSPLKIQGDNYDCWAFATVASLESSLLKATGNYYNLSVNYIQKMQLKYHPLGDLRISLTGFAYSGLGHALSWIGALEMDAGYDDRGMISDEGAEVERIHLQDAMIIFPDGNNTVDAIKRAIMKYGAVSVQYLFGEEPGVINVTGDDVDFTDHGIHFFNLIGWDDNYQGDEGSGGAWIIKDSMDEFKVQFYNSTQVMAVDYYALVPQNAVVVYIFENDIDYHVNYQTDLTALTGFDANYTYYSNEFTSKYDELIGAVGTYFNESGISYSFDVYVNGEKVHTQAGISEFAGFRTIILDKYLPVRAGDRFKVVFKNNNLPYQAYSRVHYLPGMSMISADGNSWKDITLENRTVCLKVYTVPGDFAKLNQSISEAEGMLNLTCDYSYDYGEIFIRKEGDFVLNGNNHTIEGVSNCKAFDIESHGRVIINDLTFKNCNNFTMQFSSSCVLNNVRFINCTGGNGDQMLFVSNDVVIDNCRFEMQEGSYNFAYNEGELSVKNSVFTSTGLVKGNAIYSRGSLYIENSTFEDMMSDMATAINYKGSNMTIKRSRFLNLQALLSGGAVMMKFFPYDDKTVDNVSVFPFVIEDCEFSNVTSSHDGGAIYADLDSGSERIKKIFNISGCNFTSCSSGYGGAVALQGGFLNIKDCRFVNCSADFEGGALFTTWSRLNISDSRLVNNTAAKNAGAIYFDKGKLSIAHSVLTGNRALRQSGEDAMCIYAHDVEADFSHSTFDNGGISVYADFASDSRMDNVTRNDDIFLLDNRNYMLSVESNGIRLNLTKNEFIYDKLPSKFDLRDWGWVTPAKRQGDNDDCWAFATVASLETSLLKAAGNSYNLSENYVQHLQLKYSRYGDLRISFTGFGYSGLGYALSWIGALPLDGPYDERGLISDTDLDDARIHLQDAMIIFGGRNDTVELLKQAIIKYGGVAVPVCGNGPIYDLPTEGDDIALMEHGIHFVSLIGWDDNYDGKDMKGPVWISKDSISGFAHVPMDDPELLGMDYYAIVPQNAGICYIFENDINYHVNYQTDLTALTGFDANYTCYSNEFTSKYDELIGAVGTYFNESGISYSFDVYVNGEKVHTQTGISEFAGFRTIILDKYLPVRAGDRFKVVFKNNNLPYQAYSRVHYLPGMSMISADGNSWKDITLENRTVCLKVYTVADDCRIVDNRDMTVTYADGSYFTVRVVTGDGRRVGAGETVTFTINGKTLSAKTDANGVAGFKIVEKAGTYVITSSVNGNTFKNTVVVKAKPKPADKIVLKASKVTVKKKSAKRIVLKATLKINGKAVKGKIVKFRFKGKTYKAKTNSRGIAKKVLKKSVIKKLKKGKKYTVKVTYLKKTVKTTVRVR